MISAWDIYWVMQLDSIAVAAVIFGIFLAIGTFIALIIGYCEDKPEALGAGKKLAGATFAMFAAVAFLPSTKTAAAMIVIPAVANNEAIQREAGDLYAIAKDALRELARPKPAAPKESE